MTIRAHCVSLQLCTTWPKDIWYWQWSVSSSAAASVSGPSLLCPVVVPIIWLDWHWTDRDQSYNFTISAAAAWLSQKPDMSLLMAKIRNLHHNGMFSNLFMNPDQITFLVVLETGENSKHVHCTVPGVNWYKMVSHEQHQHQRISGWKWAGGSQDLVLGL